MLYQKREEYLPVYYLKNLGDTQKDPTVSLNCVLSPGKIKALHYHEGAEIGICVSGEGLTYIGDRIYHYRKGDLQYVSPYVPHLSASDEKCGESVWVWISFSPEQMLIKQNISIEAAVSKLNTTDYSCVFHPEENEYLSVLFEKFKELLSLNENYNRTEAAFLAGLIIMETVRFCGTEKQSDRSGITEKAIMYISENYADKEAVTESKIADYCNLSCSHLRALFKRETGVSIRDFLVKTRLAAAAYSLRQTEKPILEIAFEAGFGQISCFNRLFRKIFGVTPREYRRLSKF